MTEETMTYKELNEKLKDIVSIIDYLETNFKDTGFKEGNCSTSYRYEDLDNNIILNMWFSDDSSSKQITVEGNEIFKETDSYSGTERTFDNDMISNIIKKLKLWNILVIS